MQSFRRRFLLLAVGLLSVAPTVTAAQADSDVPDSVASLPGREAFPDNLFLVKGREYGTDAYAGPLDVLFNKGLAVAQWPDKDRRIFSHPYGWGAVWASITRPGPAVEKAGGWGKTLRRHLLPFGGDEIREGQWLTNWFGHVVEGGLSYRRILEWNRVKGVPFPTLTALLTTQLAATVNEAYETPVGDPWVQENGTAGLFVDWVIMDPLGMLLFHQDGITRFFSEELGAVVWPRQASITLPHGQLINNGQSVVYRPALWFTDDVRLFVRTGVGVEAGLSVARDDGLEVSVGLGVQSTGREVDPDTHEVWVDFGPSAGLWIDRDGSLLSSLTWERATDRWLSVNLYPGVFSVGGISPGVWFQVDQDRRPSFGITGRGTLGGGVGVVF